MLLVHFAPKVRTARRRCLRSR